MSKAEKRRGGAEGRLDFAAAATMAALSLFLFFWFIPTYAPGEGGAGQIAPSLFPRLAVGVVFLCAIPIMARNVWALAAPGSGVGVQIIIETAGWTVFACALFAMLRWVGFVPAGIFAVTCGALLTRYYRRPVVVAVLAVGLPVLLDWSVWKIFWIDLP